MLHCTVYAHKNCPQKQTNVNKQTNEQINKQTNETPIPPHTRFGN